VFVKAVEEVAEFTRPVHSIVRTYGSHIIEPSASTLFIVNDEGWALTCKHVAALFPEAERIRKQYAAFKNDLNNPPAGAKPKKHRRNMEKKYSLSKTSPVQLLNMARNCVDTGTGLSGKAHKDLDVALIKFEGFGKLLCSDFPKFPKDTSGLKPGKYLCRLGYPFVEFTNFEYDKLNDQLQWTSTGRQDSPRFPLEGMVTRNVAEDEKVIGFEMSTPGLRGQSGGPAFDQDGIVWGMQSGTKHLYLNFDVDLEVIRGGQEKHVKESAFLHVGHCIHVDVLKDFMTSNKVKFTEV